MNLKRTPLPSVSLSLQDIEPTALLTFRVGAREYGVDLRHVAEIRDLGTSSRDEVIPRSVVAVLPLNGKQIPFVDLRQLFSGGSSDSDRTTAVVLRLDDVIFGIFVDAVCAIEETGQFSQSLSQISTLDVESMLAWLPGDERKGET